MKIITSFIVAAFFSITVFGQNVIDKHFEEYKSQDNYTNVQVSSKMFELAGYIDFQEDDKELNEIKDFITTIDALNMIIGREVEAPFAKYTSALSKVEKSHEELMRVDDADDHVTFLIDESRGVVREVVMIGTTDRELFICSLTGKMNLRDLSKMANKMQNSGFSHMKMLSDHKAADVKIYPNPTVAGEGVNVEMPENLVGGTATLYDMQGKSVKSVDISSTNQSIATQGLTSGSYVVHLTKDGVTMKKRVVIQSK